MRSSKVQALIAAAKAKSGALPSAPPRAPVAAPGPVTAGPLTANRVRSILQAARARHAAAPPPARPVPAPSSVNLAKVTYALRLAATLHPDELQILRRVLRLRGGELPPEGALPPLPAALASFAAPKAS